MEESNCGLIWCINYPSIHLKEMGKITRNWYDNWCPHWGSKQDLLNTSHPTRLTMPKFSLWWNLPSVPFNLSFVGSKLRVPAIDSAVTSSGDVTNAWVAGLASLRPVKLRLYDVTMVFFSPFLTSLRSHWPMQGPQALARTVPPKSLSVWA
jgi:hypothetical protein